tara:strand:- start:220 stop:819 length:600 start_codon:yes stop_codon:yes gene_type:complete
MAGIGIALRGLGLLGKKAKTISSVKPGKSVSSPIIKKLKESTQMKNYDPKNPVHKEKMNKLRGDTGKDIRKIEKKHGRPKFRKGGAVKKLTTKKILNSDAGQDIMKNVYDHVASKHSLGQKKKPHSSREGRTASVGRAMRDTMKILSPKREKKFGGGHVNTSRENRLEELGRVDAEKAYSSKGKRNLKDEKKRIVKELS